MNRNIFFFIIISILSLNNIFAGLAAGDAFNDNKPERSKYLRYKAMDEEVRKLIAKRDSEIKKEMYRLSAKNKPKNTNERFFFTLRQV